ncbi:MAG: ribokinase [Treponema sp.]|jgi:ribokinase|nr:ribokinase [Treponema sp.]
MKFLVFGSLNIDLIFSVDHIVCPGETINSSALERSAGGKGANQAAALAKAGMEVYMAGKIGHDGDFLLELLQSYGVRTNHIMHWEGATGQALIQVDKTGQNSIVLYGGGNAALKDSEVPAIISSFSAGDIVLLQNEIPVSAAVMRTARERGMKVCLNPSPFDERIADLPLELADILFVNEIEAAGLTGLPASQDFETVLEKLAGRFPKTEIILTAGKEGAFYALGTLRAKGDIVDLPVADTTGAGDTFSGFFLAARERGCDVTESLRLACKASSIAVSRKGAMASMPFAGEVF